MTTPHLEAERQAILSRMQASREHYRRMLMGEETRDYQTAKPVESEVINQAAPNTSSPNTSYYGHDSDGMYGHDHSQARHQAPPQDMAQLQNAAMDVANMAFGWVRQHPVMSAAIVAAIVAIGPRRIMKSMAAGGTAVGAAGAFAMRNPQNIEMLTRLFNTVAANYKTRSSGSGSASSQYSPP